MVNVYLFSIPVSGKTYQTAPVSVYWWCSQALMSQEPGAPGTTDRATGLSGKRLLYLAAALPWGPQLAGFHLPALWSLVALLERVTWARVLGNRSRSVLRFCMSPWALNRVLEDFPVLKSSVNVEILIIHCRLGTGKKIECFVQLSCLTFYDSPFLYCYTLKNILLYSTSLMMSILWVNLWFIHVLKCTLWRT